MSPAQFPRPRNLGISQRIAVLAGFLGTLLAVVCLSWAVAIYGVDDRTAPVILPLFAIMGLAISQLITSLKASEAADSSSRTAQVAHLTASQNATIMQALTAHCGDLCPLDVCPLREVQTKWQDL